MLSGRGLDRSRERPPQTSGKQPASGTRRVENVGGRGRDSDRNRRRLDRRRRRGRRQGSDDQGGPPFAREPGSGRHRGEGCWRLLPARGTVTGCRRWRPRRRHLGPGGVRGGRALGRLLAGDVDVVAAAGAGHRRGAKLRCRKCEQHSQPPARTDCPRASHAVTKRRTCSADPNPLRQLRQTVGECSLPNRGRRTFLSLEVTWSNGRSQEKRIVFLERGAVRGEGGTPAAVGKVGLVAGHG
jgi:hypothetical protein